MVSFLLIIVFYSSLAAFVQAVPELRIVGGLDAVGSQLPHQVSLRFHGSHFCGASIISRNYILTAAHCVVFHEDGIYTFPQPTEYTIYAGSVNRLFDGVEIPVAAIIVHENYTFLENDIALLKLTESLNFNDKVKAIPLAKNQPSEDSFVIISGWGSWKRSQESPMQLQWTISSLIGMKECAEINNFSDVSVICLRYVDRSSCFGDSGGPAISNNELIGVCSFGSSDCESSYPNGYTNVFYYLEWIKEHSDL